MIRAAIAVALIFATLAFARADTDEYPVYLTDAWRARLATLAPACGLKDADWGLRAAQGVEEEADREAPHQTVLFASVPRFEIGREIEGAVAAAAYLGTKIATLGPEACRSLAEVTAIKDADDAAPEKASSEPRYQLPANVLPVVDEAFAIGIARGCGRITETAENGMQSGLLWELRKDGDKEVERESGGLDLANYAGRRVADRLKRIVCKSISSSQDFRKAVQLRAYLDKHPDEMWKGFGVPGPDD